MKPFPRSLLPCFLGFIFSAQSCAPAGENGSEPYRVAVATFSHETCTFCPGGT